MLITRLIRSYRRTIPAKIVRMRAGSRRDVGVRGEHADGPPSLAIPFVFLALAEVRDEAPDRV